MKIMLPMLKRYTNYGYHELLRFQNEKSNLYFEWKSVNGNACNNIIH